MARRHRLRLARLVLVWAPFCLCFGLGGLHASTAEVSTVLSGAPALFTTSAMSNKVYRVDSDGSFAEIAGRGFRASEDGSREEASFFKPNGIVLGRGEILVSEPTGSIRRIAFPELIESPEGTGSSEGSGTFSASVEP